MLREGFESINLSHTHTHTRTDEILLSITLTIERQFVTLAWLLHQPDACVLPEGGRIGAGSLTQCFWKMFIQQIIGPLLLLALYWEAPEFSHSATKEVVSAPGGTRYIDPPAISISPSLNI